jgi:hypothetical protein
MPVGTRKSVEVNPILNITVEVFTFLHWQHGCQVRVFSRFALKSD